MLRRALALSLLAAGAAGAQAAPAPDPCARAAGDRVQAFVALPQGTGPAPDGSVKLALCLVPSRAGDAIASYRGELRYDSTTIRVVGMERGRGGMRIENGAKAGRVLFAGASPNGFRDPLVLRVALAPAVPRLGSIHLVLHELTAVDGRDLSAGAHIAGYSDSKTNPAPTPRRQTSRAH